MNRAVGKPKRFKQRDSMTMKPGLRGVTVAAGGYSASVRRLEAKRVVKPVCYRKHGEKSQWLGPRDDESMRKWEKERVGQS